MGGDGMATRSKPQDKAPKQSFAAVPARAMGDQDLSALDLRVLMAIAFHDRFSKNGIGCYASPTRLSSLLGCHTKSLSRSLSTLGRYGYIEAIIHPLNKRLRVYSVIYTSEDGVVASSTRGIGNESVTDSPSIGNQFATEDDLIGNQDLRETESDQEHAGVNIFSETGRYPVETERDSPEGALSRDNARFSKKREPSIGERLARFERALQAEQIPVEDLDKYSEQLETLCYQLQDYEDPNYHRANRLLEDVGDRLYAQQEGRREAR
jgi:hypothetical protein